MNSILYPIFFFIGLVFFIFSFLYLFFSEWFDYSAEKLFSATIILDIVMSVVFYNIHASNFVISLYFVLLIPMFPIALVLWIDEMLKNLDIVSRTWDMPIIRIRRK